MVLQLPDDAKTQQVNQTLGSFVSSKLLERLSGRLAIVEPWRVRFRHA
jgi:hypothetical protein